MCSYFISLGNELKPEPFGMGCDCVHYFISLGNELKPERSKLYGRKSRNFISLGNELKPELSVESAVGDHQFYIVRKRA